MDKKSIKSVIHFTDGRAAAFDDSGREMSEFSGRYKDVRTKILKAANFKTVFRREESYDRVRIVQVDREVW